MATKWLPQKINCRWCGNRARVGIEKDGQGKCYRIICDACGVAEQIGRRYPAGKMLAELLSMPESWI